GARLDPGLAVEIGARVAGEEGALAPVLQLLMTRLWRAARAADPVHPRLRHAALEEVRDSISLADYLGQQLRVPSFESGLAHSILRFHTTRTVSLR
ncbi:hypothetical protein ACJEKK_25370, partial [Escherichia coli]